MQFFCAVDEFSHICGQLTWYAIVRAILRMAAMAVEVDPTTDTASLHHVAGASRQFGVHLAGTLSTITAAASDCALPYGCGGGK